MLNIITTYGILALYYGLFFLAVDASVKCNSGSLEDIVNGKGEAGVLLNRLMAGIFFLGIGALQIIFISNTEADLFVLSKRENEAIPYWLPPAAIAFMAGLISAVKKPVAGNMGMAGPAYLFPLIYFIIRLLFLVVYEIFFRAALLFVMIEDFGVAVAVAANIFLYVLIHWHNKKERMGSVFMGLILCAASIYYHSVWPAVIIHAALALSYESLLLFRHFLKILKLQL